MRDSIYPSDRGVSSVISVILMVAVTVILAATIATFVLGFGESTDNVTPQTDFSFEYKIASCAVEVKHSEGENLENKNLRLAGAAKQYRTYGSIKWDGGATTVKAGDRTTVSVEQGEKLRVVWRESAGAGSDSTAILSDYEVPEKGTCGGITSFTQTHAAGDFSKSPDKNGEFTVEVSGNNLGGSVYVVLEDAKGPSWNTETSILISGGTGSKTITSCSSNVYDGETVTATLYESNKKNNQLDQKTVTANAISGNYNGGPSSAPC